MMTYDLPRTVPSRHNFFIFDLAALVMHQTRACMVQSC